MKKFIITVSLVFLAIVITLSLINVEFARDLPSTTTIYDSQDTYISFTMIDKTVEDKIRTSMFARGLWSSYKPAALKLSDYGSEWLSLKPPGPAYTKLVHSSRSGKIISLDTSTPISETTDDGFCYFSISAVDATKDIYEVNLRLEFRTGSENGYLLYLEDPVKIKKDLGTLPVDGILELPLYDIIKMTRLSGSLQKTKDYPYLDGSDRRTITVRDIKIRAPLTSIYDTHGLVVLHTSPEHGSSDNSRTSRVRITFSLPMDTSVADLYVNNDLVKAEWINESTLQYKPSLPFPADTSIWIDIPPEHKSLDGETFAYYAGPPNSFWFRTARQAGQ
jgi:hypothetical protein